MDQTLSWALSQLSGMHGIKHAHIHFAPSEFVSTFPAERHAEVETLCESVALMLATLRLIEKGHNEAYIEFDGELAAAFQITEKFMVVLATEKMINIPMISLEVRAVAAVVRDACLKPRTNVKLAPAEMVC